MKTKPLTRSRSPSTGRLAVLWLLCTRRAPWLRRATLAPWHHHRPPVRLWSSCQRTPPGVFLLSLSLCCPLSFGCFGSCSRLYFGLMHTPGCVSLNSVVSVPLTLSSRLCAFCQGDFCYLTSIGPLLFDSALSSHLSCSERSPLCCGFVLLLLPCYLALLCPLTCLGQSTPRFVVCLLMMLLPFSSTNFIVEWPLPCCCILFFVVFGAACLPPPLCLSLFDESGSSWLLAVSVAGLILYLLLLCVPQ